MTSRYTFFFVTSIVFVLSACGGGSDDPTTVSGPNEKGLSVQGGLVPSGGQLEGGPYSVTGHFQSGGPERTELSGQSYTVVPITLNKSSTEPRAPDEESSDAGPAEPKDANVQE